MPKVEITPEGGLDFERLMLSQQEKKKLKNRNTTNIPVYWKIQNKFLTQQELDEEEFDAAAEENINQILPQFEITPKIKNCNSVRETMILKISKTKNQQMINQKFLDTT